MWWQLTPTLILDRRNDLAETWLRTKRGSVWLSNIYLLCRKYWFLRSFRTSFIFMLKKNICTLHIWSLYQWSSSKFLFLFLVFVTFTFYCICISTSCITNKEQISWEHIYIYVFVRFINQKSMKLWLSGWAVVWPWKSLHSTSVHTSALFISGK